MTGGTQQFTVIMPADSKDGVYTVQGLLKRTSDGAVLAADSLDFEFKNGEVLIGPKLTHTLSPDTLTNKNVTVTPKVADASGCTAITFSPASRTATENGDYEFTVSYKLPSGKQRTKLYTVTVDNIDKEPPNIGFSAFTVTESMTQKAFEKLFEESLTVTDNRTKDCTVNYTLPKVEDVRAAGGGKVTVTAQDEAGNRAALDCVLIVTSPLAFSKPTAVRQGTTMTFTLTAKLTAIGKKAVTETGFVWGIMPKPSLTFNQGSAKTASPVTKANVNFSVKTTEIVEGMTYHARAYAKVGDVCYYSDPVDFDIGAKQCGTFTIKNNGNNTFTVKRTGGTEVAQTVYYRMVNGTAVGGTHFTHKASTLTFKEGETQKTITVSEKSVTNTYGGKTGTAYANADRTYQVELYRVTGGGTLGDTVKATRTMTRNSGYTIDRSVYQEIERSVDQSGSNFVSDRKNSKDNQILFSNDRGYNLKQPDGETGCYKNFNVQRTMLSYSGFSDKTDAYLKATADGYYYRLNFRAAELEDGWEHIWIADHAPNQFNSGNEYSGPMALDDSNLWRLW